jgi:hypothetical protein
MTRFRATHWKTRSSNNRRYSRRLERLECRTLLDGAGAATVACYGQLPISFEINQGQTDPQVNFLARGSGYGLYLTPNAAVLSLQQPQGQQGANAGVSAQRVASHGDVLQMQFLGANPTAQAVGVDQLPGVSNYLIGNDPAKWHTGIANFGQVEYQDLYHGVNLIYYGNQRQLEYDFVVAAGADPAQIAFDFVGTQSTALDAQGNLVLHASGGDVIEHAPVVYQQTANGRQTIDGHYRLASGGRVGFTVGAFDHSQPLVIDPILSYATYLGGSYYDYANAIAADAAGEAYVTGYTASTNFPTTTGALQTSNNGSYDAFVAKLNVAGSALIYSTYLGGSGDDEAAGIAIDAAGEAYVTGYTASTNFPTTTGASQTSNAGGNDAFVAKLNAAGSEIVYSTYLGGSGDDRATGIAIDPAGEAFVTGYTNSTNFPTTTGALQTSNVGGDDAFAAKFNAAGSALIYSTYLGGSDYDQATGIAIDPAGEAYVTGFTTSTNFPTTTGALQTSNVGGDHAFVAKLNSAGSALIYSTYLGGSIYDHATSIAIDPAGEAYVTGFTTSTNFPTTTGALQTFYAGGGDAFVAKLNAAGSALIYSTYLGGSDYDQAAGIAIDPAGEAYVTGFTTSTNLPTTTGAPQTFYAGGGDAFVAKLNTAGSALIYSTYLGGSVDDQATGIAIDPAGEAYVVGSTYSTNFPTTAGALQPTVAGNEHAFVFKLATTALELTAAPIAATEGTPFTGTVGFLIDEAQAFAPVGAFTALVAWGDGSTSNATVVPLRNGFNLLATHTYTEDGPYSLNLVIVDSDGDSAFTATNASVADAALSAVGKNVVFTEGVAASHTLATFEDADPRGAAGDYSATITWGDGQSSTGSIVADGGGFDVVGTHQYNEEANNLPITVTIQDAGGATTTAAGSASIGLSAKGVSLTVTGTKQFTGTVATFSDLGLSPNNDFTATIAWGDSPISLPGTVKAGTGIGNYIVTGTHTYGSFLGSLAIVVTITDGDSHVATVVTGTAVDPTAGQTPNQAYVASAYQDLFGAAGTSTTVVAGVSLADWATKLDTGTPRSTFAAAIVHSAEYYGSVVDGIYQKYLGRSPDATGRTYWVGQLQQGMTDEQLEAAFAGAAEYYQHAGGSDAAWVGAMYVDILGRAADATGLAFWTSQLAHGANRADVALGFAVSLERENQRVEDDYFNDLGRTADDVGLAFWVNAFEHGTRNEDVIAGLLASDEYYQAHSS